MAIQCCIAIAVIACISDAASWCVIRDILEWWCWGWCPGFLDSILIIALYVPVHLFVRLVHLVTWLFIDWLSDWFDWLIWFDLIGLIEWLRVNMGDSLTINLCLLPVPVRGCPVLVETATFPRGADPCLSWIASRIWWSPNCEEVYSCGLAMMETVLYISVIGTELFVVRHRWRTIRHSFA